MNGGLRASMSWLHTWTGLISGWLVFAIFATGTATVFRHEIEAWARPSLSANPDPAAGLQRAYDHLLTAAPQATLFGVQAPSRQERDMQAYWSNLDGTYGQAELDPATGAPVADPPTGGGEMFYRFHFELMAPYPYGRLAACLAAAFFASAVVSGVITHKRIFSDFFTFRPEKGGQRAWLDGHNVLGVLALPFHLFIALTGIITLATTFMPFGMVGGYGKDLAAFYADSAPETRGMPERAGKPAVMAPLGPMISTAERQLGGQVLRLTVNNPGDASARVTLHRDNEGRLSRPAVAAVFDGVTGKLLTASPPPGPAMATNDLLYGLHMAEFAGPALRWLYFFAGLSGCGLIASGLVLWTVSRRRKLPDPAKPYFGFRLVEVMNVGAVMGLPLAIAGFFWADRLLPADLAERPAVEGRIFLATIAATIVYSALRPQKRAWTEAAWLAAFAFAAIPLLSAATGGRNLAASAAAGDWAMVALDLTLVALGGGFLFMARRAGRVAAPTPRRAARTAAAE
ncbi:PepSY-associated TM helix domain-containing protein [Phenylobacterium sp.]|uniref:PepSY-associated TM helix domain-containing protein n=1 Tax=Phenylobacterium sp. TaxID=1871053 RepID=UPI0025FF704C|nr:PepSY-associated TM helix domain-containing protein [Phenylobacterium sp.]